VALLICVHIDMNNNKRKPQAYAIFDFPRMPICKARDYCCNHLMVRKIDITKNDTKTPQPFHPSEKLELF
jgi:hypothetical protein